MTIRSLLLGAARSILDQLDPPPKAGELELWTEFPITSCCECRTPYRLAQWRALPLVSRDGTKERRTCSVCRTVIYTDASWVDKVGREALEVRAATYLRLYNAR